MSPGERKDNLVSGLEIYHLKENSFFLAGYKGFDLLDLKNKEKSDLFTW